VGSTVEPGFMRIIDYYLDRGVWRGLQLYGLCKWQSVLLVVLAVVFRMPAGAIDSLYFAVARVRFFDGPAAGS